MPAICIANATWDHNPHRGHFTIYIRVTEDRKQHETHKRESEHHVCTLLKLQCVNLEAGMCHQRFSFPQVTAKCVNQLIYVIAYLYLQL